MRQWISLWSIIRMPIILYVLIVVLNIVSSVVGPWYIERFYRETGPSESALHRLITLGRYASGCSNIALLYIFFLLILPYTNIIGVSAGVIITIIIPFIFLVLLMIFDYHMTFPVYRKIHKTSESEIEGLKRQLSSFVYSFTWFSILQFALLFAEEYYTERGVPIFQVFFPVLIVLLLTFQPLLASLLFRKQPKVTLITTTGPYAHILEFLNKIVKERHNVYIIHTGSRKLANAYFSDSSEPKKILITDYLLSHFTSEEVENVVAHEVAHGRKRHALINAYLRVLFLIPLALISVEASRYLKSNAPLVVWGIPLTVGVVMFPLVFYYIRRNQERRADYYAMQMGVRPQVAISALLKLTKINHSPIYLHKAEEILRTHPSTADRINWIMKRYGVSSEEYKLLEDRVHLQLKEDY